MQFLYSVVGFSSAVYGLNVQVGNRVVGGGIKCLEMWIGRLFKKFVW